MATRFYFGKILADTVPAFSVTWQMVATTAPVRALMRTVKTQTLRSNAPFVQTTTEAVALGPSNHLCAQFISRPLAAQTITGTFKGYALFSEQNAAHNSRVWCEIRVLSPSGTVRGTSFTGAGVLSSEFNVGTPTNRRIPVPATANTLASVTAQAGDFLVVEIGFRTDPTGVTSVISFQWHDDPATGDLPEDETSTDTTLAPWVEFSQTLILQDQFDQLQVDPPKYLGLPDLSPLKDNLKPVGFPEGVDLGGTSLGHNLLKPVYDEDLQSVGDINLTAFSTHQDFLVAEQRAGLAELPAYEVLLDQSLAQVVQLSTPSNLSTLVDPTDQVTGNPGTINYTNRAYDAVAGRFVRWVTTSPDTGGSAYPGPGVFGVTTSDYVVERRSVV